jgi:phospholipid/cholesterol/gamma-HCH transport system permease protein
MATPAEGWFETARDRGTLILDAGGRWIAAAAAALDVKLRRLDSGDARRATLDLGGVEALDTAGAWLLLRTRHDLEARGVAVEFANARAEFEPLLRQVEESAPGKPLPHPLPEHHTFVGFLAGIGRKVNGSLAKVRDMVGFLGLVCISAAQVVRHPSRLRFTALVAHMEQTGVDALPIVGLLAFLIGVVSAYQGVDQLRRFGVEIYTVNLVGIGVLRELGVLLTAIILAGRSGSAFTAQIGTMQVNEEVDAMRTIGLDPVAVLVLPRLFAMMITLPLLAFYANVMGLLGGAVTSYFTLDIQFPAFLRQLRSALPVSTFWLGLLKAPVFAGIIALTGCFEGMRVAGSAESVGRNTTVSVVESIFLIIVVDAVFSIVFSLLAI